MSQKKCARCKVALGSNRSPRNPAYCASCLPADGSAPAALPPDAPVKPARAKEKSGATKRATAGDDDDDGEAPKAGKSGAAKRGSKSGAEKREAEVEAEPQGKAGKSGAAKRKAEADPEAEPETKAKARSSKAKRPAARAYAGEDDGEDAPAAKAKAKSAAKKRSADDTSADTDDDGSGDGEPTGKKKVAGKKKAKAGKKKVGEKKLARRGIDDIADDYAAGQDADEYDVDPEDTLSGEGTGKALVVVESPAKAKTINKYLGSSFRVMASMGHVRDLPKSPPKGSLGIDIDGGTFEPMYEPLPEKEKVITELKRRARNARAIYLAPDPDREGEAIAWHLSELLPGLQDRIQRVTFNQITEDAVKKAFEHPRAIDMNKVNAQQARRVVDRIVGFKLSQLLWKKVRRGLSAGRVQSVAVKLIVERERAIQAFVPVEYWDVDALLDSPNLRGSAPPAPRPAPPPVPAPGEKPVKVEVEHPPYRFEANLVRLRGLRLDPKDGARIGTADEARALEQRLATATYRVASVEQKERRSNPKPPFITSTLQQSSGFGAQRTMRIAQGLYEGVDLGPEGAVGLITYMRTDSVNLAPEAVAEAREFIGREYGADYLPAEPVAYKRGKQKVAAQEAHEAIRPTSAMRTPDSVARFLEPDQLRLYKLIWERFVACQMMPARSMGMTVDVEATPKGAKEAEAVFRSNGSRLLFDGHYRVSGREQGDKLLPDVKEGEVLDLVPPLTTQQKFTQPPSRYSEASLVKKLEEEGIGRPSTYANIISTIQNRGYVQQVNKALHATTSGMVVTGKLDASFPHILDYGYTRTMERDLDRIEGAVVSDPNAADADASDDGSGGGDGEGETLPPLDWRQLLRDFYAGFARDLERAHTEMKGVNEEPPVTEHACPKCGAKMLRMINTTEFTSFLGCPNYKDGCKTTIPLDADGNPSPDRQVDAWCPKDKKQLVLKSGRRGQFFACSGYPECKQTFEVGPDGMPLPKPDVSADCPNCKTDMLVRRGRTGYFLGCPKYPECRGTLPIVQAEDGVGWKIGEKRSMRQELPKVDIKCVACGKPMAVKRSRKGFFIGCTGYPKCKTTGEVPSDVKLPEKPKPQEIGEECDLCGKPLILREGMRGQFISCSGYPKCKNTRNLPPGFKLPVPAVAAAPPRA